MVRASNGRRRCVEWSARRAEGRRERPGSEPEGRTHNRLGLTRNWGDSVVNAEAVDQKSILGASRSGCHSTSQFSEPATRS